MAKTTDSKAPKAKSTAAAVKAKSQSKGSETGKTKTAPTGPPRQPGVERRKNHPSRAKHGHIQLILTQAISKLGQPGDVVNVRPGFARNFLVPQGLATFATQNNLRMVEKHRQRLKQLEEARRADLQNLAAQLAHALSRSKRTPMPRVISTARSVPIRSRNRCGTRDFRSRARMSESKDPSRSLASIPSRSSWLKRFMARSSSGWFRPIPRKRRAETAAEPGPDGALRDASGAATCGRKTEGRLGSR